MREERSVAEWTEIVRVACADAGIPARELRMFERGTAIVFDVGGTHVVKLTAPKWISDADTEWTFLSAVHGALPFETSEPVARGDVDGWPWVITSQLKGEHLDTVWATLDHAARLDMARQIGELMKIIHALDIPGLQSNATYETELDPVPLHTELLGEHVLVRQDGDRWKISGVLDFAEGTIGPPEYEIAAPVEFLFKSEPDLLVECLEVYGWPRPLDADEGRRLLGLALLHRYGSYARILEAAGNPDPGDFEGVRKRLYPFD